MIPAPDTASQASESACRGLVAGGDLATIRQVLASHQVVAIMPTGLEIDEPSDPTRLTVRADPDVLARLLAGDAHEVQLLLSGTFSMHGARKSVLRFLTSMPDLAEAYAAARGFDHAGRDRLTAARDFAASMQPDEERSLPAHFALDDRDAHARLAAAILVHLTEVCQATEVAALIGAHREGSLPAAAIRGFADHLASIARTEPEIAAAVAELADDPGSWASTNALRISLVHLCSMASSALAYRRAANALDLSTRSKSDNYFLGAA